MAEQKIQSQRAGVRPGDPCALVIFGAAGDLTKRLLVPSLYNLHASKLLPENFAMVEVTAAQFSDEDFREKLTKDIQADLAIEHIAMLLDYDLPTLIAAASSTA